MLALSVSIEVLWVANLTEHRIGRHSHFEEMAKRSTFEIAPTDRCRHLLCRGVRRWDNCHPSLAAS